METTGTKCTDFEVMTTIRNMDKENLEGALFDALFLVSCYGRDEGYIPRDALKEYEGIKHLLPGY